MAARSETQSWLQQNRKGWLFLTQGALWVGGALGGFLLPPPVGVSTSDQKVWLHLGQFVIAVIFGLVFFAARRWNRPQHAIRWSGASLLFLAVAVVAFFRYQQLTLKWTGNYMGSKVIVGSVYTPQGLAAVKENPEASVDWLINDFTGVVENIWTLDSINSRRLLLAATYVSCLPLFALCLMAVVQTIHCGIRDPSRKRSKAKHHAA